MRRALDDTAGPKEASSSAQPGAAGFVRELVTFAWRHKMFWLIPIALVAASIAVLLFFNYSFAPFHYTVM